MMDRQLIVYALKRKEFITPFVHMLANDKQDYHLQGPKQLARLLCLIADFRDWNNPATSVSHETIEHEIIRLRRELYPDE